MMKALLFILTALSFAALRSDAQTGKMEIHFLHRAGDRPLLPDSSYTNAFDETFSITRFKYYISNVHCGEAGMPQQRPVPENCFLVRNEDPSSCTIRLSVPEGEYDWLQFLLGVDSLKNVSGAQSGALDPLNDMFWTWNTGYVMAKLEGNSPVSKLPRQMIEYHIGGFRGPYSVLKQVQLSMPGGKKIKVKKDKTTIVEVKADLLKWFSGKHALSIAEYNSCTIPGALALRYAENYSNMFSIQSVKQP